MLCKIMLSIVILSLLLGTHAKAANILCVFPTAAYSHQQPMLALSHALAAKGHNLTVITTNPSKVPIKNHREIDISSLYKLYRGHEEMEKKTGFTTQKRSTSSMDIIKAMPAMVEYVITTILSVTEVQHFIKEVNGTNYDLMIYEAGFNSLLGFSDLIGNPPVIGLSTCQLLSTLGVFFGNPVLPSYTPLIISNFNDHMSFTERLENLWSELSFHYVMNYYSKPSEEKVMHKNFGNYHRKLHELEYNHSLIIISADLSTGYPKPLQPNTIHVGPMHIRKPDSLPEDIQKWMDESEDGVIFFSLGSNMQGTSVPENIRAAFIKVFEQFPKLRVLWKWEADTKLPGQPDNVLVKKWLPQQSILAHPKLRLFISQLGLQSFSEAVYYGIPTLGIPMYGDQNYNAKKLFSSGAGLFLDLQSITYENLYEKLSDLITNQSYKENMLRLSAITRDTAMPPVETAVWWVEYVLRHNGAPHLRPAVLDLTWYQYYMLDIFVVIILILLAGICIFYFLVKKIINFVLSSISRTSMKVEHKNKND